MPLSDFSFVKNDVNDQTKQETLHVAFYELGHMVEYWHKEKRYGPDGYYNHKNQQKETADLISMIRFYCEQMGFEFPNYQPEHVGRLKSLIEECLGHMTVSLGRIIEHDMSGKVRPYIITCVHDLVLNLMLYCHLRKWDFFELAALGEQAYLDRMKDLKEHGLKAKGKSKPHFHE